MKRILGILILLAAIYVVTWFLADFPSWVSDRRPIFMTGYNQENLLRRTALYGILGVGVAFVIITGGIDLSLGSMVCLVGVGVPWCLVTLGWDPWFVMALVVVVPLAIGLFHGVLVTKVNLQPFVVTLCGLLIYRGVTRGYTNDQSAGFGTEFKGLRVLATGELPIVPGFGAPVPFLIFAVVCVLAWIFLNRTIYGRYLLALGANESAAKFSGIHTHRMTIVAYVICSGLAGLAGLLFVLDNNFAQPVDMGNFYELYAIAAAVLGGCSLRGGRGSITGVVIGTALIVLLQNMINLVLPSNFKKMEFAIVGLVILIGVIADEIARMIAARRRLARRGT